jgi:signal transduction histidine kinase
MKDFENERAALADHLRSRRSDILHAWRAAVVRDPTLSAGDSLPSAQLFDHIPAMLDHLERTIRGVPETAAAGDAAPTMAPAAAALGDASAQASAAAHGLQRWQQGYDLRQVTRELGRLNECVVCELDDYAASHPAVSHSTMIMARRAWAASCSLAVEESVGKYFQLQQQEASGHVRDLEAALDEIKELEQNRADLWRQAAHDLRGNLGVVANATVGLAHGGLRESARDDFVRILMRNVTNLHHLLDDVTNLARLQAGREQRRVEPFDATPLLQQLCEGIRPLAQERRLFLRCDGPAGFAADGDAVKVRRIAQNLILNAVKFTRQGGITVSWGNSGSDDGKRWELCVTDTGPGFQSASGSPLANALAADSGAATAASADVLPFRPASSLRESGEGIGLSIVKRLCELLDASIELKSAAGVGTTFRILFPRQYPNDAV